MTRIGSRGETSPYLLQHAHNPVDWYPWGDEAFARARAEDKPLLLSVGYSACHWCHVMERESFENPDIAGVMNRHFVNVKVDREERPDVDQIYMEAVQSMTGHGGWPMTVFLTPDGVPFYGGTYFPPDDRHGLPGFPRLLEGDRRCVALPARRRSSSPGRSSPAQLGQVRPPARRDARSLTDEVLFAAFQGISAQFDEEHGGTGGAPKFPQPMIWEFVLRFWKRTGNPYARRMVHTTLIRMARGGIYDQLGGGFARYSVDAHWLVPHFEKMLYDNAQLAVALPARVARVRRSRAAAHHRGDARLRAARDDRSRSAGSTRRRTRTRKATRASSSCGRPTRSARCSATQADDALAYWGVDRGPNFEGKNILYVAGEPDPARIAAARAALFEARERRVHPGRDDKVLASWNGLAALAFAEAGRALGRDDYVQAAVRNVDVRPRSTCAATAGCCARGRRGAGEAPRLPRRLRDGGGGAASPCGRRRSSGAGSTRRATLADDMLRLFWSDDVEGFYDTGSDHEAADRAAAQPLRQRGAVRLVGRDRSAAAARRADGRRRATRSTRCARCGRSPT